MIGNDERREVAARLREQKPWDICTEYKYCIGNICDAVFEDEGDLNDMFILQNALAELIEPEQERTCHKELMTTENYTGTEVEYFGCSECGQWLSDTDCYGLEDGPNYCENCGCKVDSSFVTDEATGEVIYRDGEKVITDEG